MYCNLIKRIAGKLQRIILLHLGLVTFRFAYGTNRKPITSMISEFLVVSLSPKTNITYLLGPHDTSNNPRRTPNHFLKNTFTNLEIWEIDSFEMLEETGTGKS